MQIPREQTEASGLTKITKLLGLSHTFPTFILRQEYLFFIKLQVKCIVLHFPESPLQKALCTDYLDEIKVSASVLL